MQVKFTFGMSEAGYPREGQDLAELSSSCKACLVLLLSGKLPGGIYRWPYSNLCVSDTCSEPGSRLGVEVIRKVRHGSCPPMWLTREGRIPKSSPHTRYVLLIKMKDGLNM